MKQAWKILIFVTVFINLYSSDAQDCPGLEITAIARNDIDISWNRACFDNSTSYLVKVTVNPANNIVECNDTIVCDGETMCSTSIRTMGCGSYIKPCDNVTMEVMANGKSESLLSNIAPFFPDADWNLNVTTISNITAEWGPLTGDYASCATNALITATVVDTEVNQSTSNPDPSLRSTGYISLHDYKGGSGPVTLVTVTYLSGDIPTETKKTYDGALQYLAAPGPPVVTSVLGNDATTTKLNVTWDKPTTPMNAENVTGYTITYLDDKTVDVNDPDAVAHELDGLTACTEYTVSVAAKWSGGTGEAGSNKGKTGSKAPGKPTNVTPVDAKWSGIKVSWDLHADSQSCPIIDYKVNFTSVEGDDEGIDVGADTLSYTTSGLPRTTNYNITVTAISEDGKTSTSDSIVYTTAYRLYDGEIAGIVCGCLAGVALIGGGIFYWYKNK